MLPVMVLDLLFVGASVYLILNDQIVPGVVMLLMGTAATGILVARIVASSRGDRSRPFGSSPFAQASLRPELIALEPALADEVRSIAQRNKIAAIKRVRELTGASLKTAKEYVDQLA